MRGKSCLGRTLGLLHSTWWHGHPSRWTPGKSSAWWDAENEGNRLRDEVENDTLSRQGWTVVRIRDFEVDKQLVGCVERVKDAVTSIDGNSRHMQKASHP
jgi:G:T-mismatch repair DNA endonuclease (very short patch repair protein)